MKSSIEVPFDALEEYKDDGLGALLAKSHLRYATIYPIHAKSVMKYTLVGEPEVVKPIQAKLMTIIIEHQKRKNGT